MNRPNILFICTDQQSGFATGHAGNEWLSTPHMDSIAQSGVSVTQSFCTYPVCSAARASHFTGLMPHRNGVTRNGLPLTSEASDMMGPTFRRAGYETVWAGKWHIPEWFPTEEDTVPGFHCVPLQKGPDKKRDRGYTEEAIRFLRRTHGRPFLLSLQLHDPHEICSLFHEDLPKIDFPPDDKLPPVPENHKAIPDEPDVIKQFRIDELQGYREVHTWDDEQWSRFRRLWDRYREDGDQEAAQTLRLMRKDRWTDRDWRRYLYVYYRLVERADRNIGRVLDALRENGLEENTLVVFTSDHGDGMGAHGWTRKMMFYEECVRVPLHMSWGGMIPPDFRDEDHLVSGVDLFPTLCDYAGIEPPEDIAGQSVKPVIENPEEPGRDCLVGEMTSLQNLTDEKWEGRMLRTPSYKYVVFNGDERGEMLFDLEADPLETSNVAGEARYEGLKNELEGKLQGWCRATDDDFCPRP